MLPALPGPSMLRVAATFLRRRPDVAVDEYGLMVRCSNKTQRTLNDLALEVVVPDGYRLAVMEIPRKVEGRSVVQIPTRVLLQVNSLSPDEGTSVRVFLSVPVERYPLPANDTLRMALHFRNQPPETKEFSLRDILDGLRPKSSLVSN